MQGGDVECICVVNRDVHCRSEQSEHDENDVDS